MGPTWQRKAVWAPEVTPIACRRPRLGDRAGTDRRVSLGSFSNSRVSFVDTQTVIVKSQQGGVQGGNGPQDGSRPQCGPPAHSGTDAATRLQQGRSVSGQ